MAFFLFIAFLPWTRDVLVRSAGRFTEDTLCLSTTVSLRDEFRIPADDERLTVVCADARNYFANPAALADVALIDLYDHRGAVPFLRDREFLASVKSHLTAMGCVILNVLGTDAWCRDCMDAVRAVFGDPVVSVQVEADGNLVLLAFMGSAAASALKTIQARSEEVKKRFQLEFPVFLQALSALALVPNHDLLETRITDALA